MKILLFLVLTLNFKMVHFTNNNGSDLNKIKGNGAYFMDPVFFRTIENRDGVIYHRSGPVHVQKKGDLPVIPQNFVYFDQLKNFLLDNESEVIHLDPNQIYHEYVYGDCLDDDRYPYATINFNPHQLRRRAIIRGWLNVRNLPTCVIITGKANIEQTSRSAAYKFQICVARVTYIYSKRGHRYYYYEWFIPKDMSKSMSWNMKFFGPDDDAWGNINS